MGVGLEDILRGGRRAEGLVQEIIPLHTEIIKPKLTSVAPEQGELFELSRRAGTWGMGDFYEMLSRGWHGTRRTITVTMDGADGDHVIKPDNVGASTISEQKATRLGQRCWLTDPQVMRYHELQIINWKKRLSYGLFRHNYRGGDRKKPSRKELFTMLGESTVYGLELPLSIVSRFWELGVKGVPKDSPLKNVLYRYNGGRPIPLIDGRYTVESAGLMRTRNNGAYDPCTGIRSQALNALLTHPEEMITLLDMDPGLFNIRRLLSPRMKVEGARVKQFPVVRITDRDHIIWLNFFLSRYQPQQLFPDSNEGVIDVMHRIDQEYRAFISTYARNGDGYNLSALRRIPPSSGADESVPF